MFSLALLLRTKGGETSGKSDINQGTEAKNELNRFKKKEKEKKRSKKSIKMEHDMMCSHRY